MVLARPRERAEPIEEDAGALVPGVGKFAESGEAFED